MKPICVITADFEAEPRGRLLLGADYAAAVSMAGGIPLIVPPLLDDADRALWADEVCASCNGIVLSGGQDLDPKFFDQPPHPALGQMNPVRDASEYALARAALAAGLPILGICRGMQVLNVAAGGGLIQDIQSARPDAHAHNVSAPRWHVTHSVSIAAGSRLHRIFNQDRLWVNSFHHQAVDGAAPGFRVAAVAEDGIIESIEGTGSQFVIGVQWHPECLVVRHPIFIELFREFVRATEDA